MSHTHTHTHTRTHTCAHTEAIWWQFDKWRSIKGASGTHNVGTTSSWCWCDEIHTQPNQIFIPSCWSHVIATLTFFGREWRHPCDSLTICEDRGHEGSKMMLQHLGGPLVAGCSIGQKPLPIHVSRWGMGRAKIAFMELFQKKCVSPPPINLPWISV